MQVFPETALRRGQALRKAFEIINGERQDRYGNPEDCFNKIAEYWSAYLERDVNPLDVANLMILFKIARAQHKGDVDSYIDLAGYCGIAADFAKGMDLDKNEKYTEYK